MSGATDSNITSSGGNAQGSSTMAATIERYFNVALYLLVLTGFGTLASTGGLDTPAVFLVGGALALRGYQLVSRREFFIPERWTTYLTLFYVFVYFADYFLVSGSFLTATVHLVLFGMVVRLFSLQKARDHFMLAALSFLMVLAAAVLTVDSVFLFSFAAFLLVAVITFVLMEMRHATVDSKTRAQEPRSDVPHKRLGYTLLAAAPALMLMILAGGFLIFFLLPRISSRYLTAYAPSSDISTGFTDRVQLGRIGQIQQSSAVVMHIQVENDLEGAYDLKWRGVALSSFDGKTWTNPAGQRLVLRNRDGSFRLTDAQPPVESVGGRRIRYQVLMEPLGTNVFFLADRPRSLTGNYRELSTDSGGAVYNLDADHPINRYDAESDLTTPAESDLRLAANTIPVNMDRYLALPPLDIRISRLAEEITAGASNNYDKAVALERYLSTRFGYTLELSRSEPRDPLAFFLFERKAGHCEYFASAMAVMLRSQHIPARMVTGFRTGEFNDLSGQYVVRASNAHAWVEAYFPGYGWVSFDPTPGSSVPTRSGWSRLLLYLDAGASFWREWVINYDVTHQRTLGQDAAHSTRQFVGEMRQWYEEHYQALLRAARRTHRKITRAPWEWLAWAVGSTVLFLLLVNARGIVRAVLAQRLRAHPERAPQQAAALWYTRMVQRLARRGWRKTPAQTPRDFVAAIQEPALQQKVGEFTRAYEAARFGESVEDAKALPDLFEEVAGGKR
jgi:protein-glutamine gamma-glutamyltransferase